MPPKSSITTISQTLTGLSIEKRAISMNYFSPL
jgi:hypothetical protein